MKYILLLVMLPLFAFGQTNELPGLWVKLKTQVQDGSNMVNQDPPGVNFLKYNFTADGFVNRSTNVLFNEYKLLYKLNRDTLQVGGVFFHVLQTRPDTITMSVDEQGQRVVYTVVKVHDLKLKTGPIFDPGLKDSVYKANCLLFPQCNETFFDFLGSLNAKPEIGQMKIIFVVTRKGKIKDYTILERSGISNGFAKSINNAFSNLDWTPAHVNDQPVNCLVTIDLSVVTRDRFSRTDGYLTLAYPFLSIMPDSTAK